jgi:1-deoxy-D-xylulose-5-phosphate synthase
MVLPALEAADRLAGLGIGATVVNCRFIKPLDEATLAHLFPGHNRALTIEEGTVVNGFGSYVCRVIAERWPDVRVSSLGLPDDFVTHGERAELLQEVGLTIDGIVARAMAMAASPARRPLRESA